MARCVVGAWQDQLDLEDQAALKVFEDQSNSMAQLHGKLQLADARFGLTAHKDHYGRRCVCYREMNSVG